MITKNFQKVKKIKGVKILNTRAREGGASAFTFYQIIGSPAKARAWRAGKKKGGLGEGIFARPPFWWVCVAEGDTQVRNQHPDFP